MKAFLIICAGLLFFGLFNLPIGYYTFLRIVVTIGAVSIIVTEFKNEFSFWIITFGLIGILFNPIIPIYFNDKTFWAIIDLLAGILFGIKAFTLKNVE